MKDYLASVGEAADGRGGSALVRDWTTDRVKCDMYGRIHDHSMRLADESNKR
jgi:hypothetical protein